MKGNQPCCFCSKCFDTNCCFHSNHFALPILSTGQNHGNLTYDNFSISKWTRQIISIDDYINNSIWADARKFSLSKSISHNVSRGLVDRSGLLVFMPLFQSRWKRYFHKWKARRQLDENRIQFRIYNWYFGFSISDGERSIPYFWRVFHLGNQFCSKWLTRCNIMCSCIGKESWTINLSRTWKFSKLLLLKSKHRQELYLELRHFPQFLNRPFDEFSPEISKYGISSRISSLLKALKERSVNIFAYFISYICQHSFTQHDNCLIHKYIWWN